MSLLLPTPPELLELLELPEPVLLAAGLPELSPWLLLLLLLTLLVSNEPLNRLVSLPEPLTLEPEDPCEPPLFEFKLPSLCELLVLFVLELLLLS